MRTGVLAQITVFKAASSVEAVVFLFLENRIKRLIHRVYCVSVRML